MTGTLGEAAKRPRLGSWLAELKPFEKLRGMAAALVPPLVTVGLLLLLWQILCMQD